VVVRSPDEVLASSNTRTGGAWHCPSHHSIDQRDPADPAADQEAQWDGHDKRDAPFEQGIQRHHREGIRKPDQHHGMDQVHGVDIGG